MIRRSHSTTRTARHSRWPDRTSDQARFAYNEAVAGFTREDLNIAPAKVDSAQADVDTLKALVNQMAVVAPADSQVFRIPVETGEFVPPGVPLITLVDLSDMWVQFDLREDLLRDLKLGSKFNVCVPLSAIALSRWQCE